MNLSHQIQLTFEDNKVQRKDNRFVNISPDVKPEVFNSQQFVGANYTFGYKNADNVAFPTLGLEFMLNADWKATLSDFNKNFLTFRGKLAIDHRIDKKEILYLPIQVMSCGSIITILNSFRLPQSEVIME